MRVGFPPSRHLELTHQAHVEEDTLHLTHILPRQPPHEQAHCARNGSSYSRRIVAFFHTRRRWQRGVATREEGGSRARGLDARAILTATLATLLVLNPELLGDAPVKLVGVGHAPDLLPGEHWPCLEPALTKSFADLELLPVRRLLSLLLPARLLVPEAGESHAKGGAGNRSRA